MSRELPQPIQPLRGFLAGGASWFNDALCRNRIGSRRERSLHYEQTERAALRTFLASNAYIGVLLIAIIVDVLLI